MKYIDKNGEIINPGDTLYNPHDRDGYYLVIAGKDGQLYLGDYDSPLEKYAPELWWSIVHT